jgi:hypothetical protein
MAVSLINIVETLEALGGYKKALEYCKEIIKLEKTINNLAICDEARSKYELLATEIKERYGKEIEKLPERQETEEKEEEITESLYLEENEIPDEIESQETEEKDTKSSIINEKVKETFQTLKMKLNYINLTLIQVVIIILISGIAFEVGVAGSVEKSLINNLIDVPIWGVYQLGAYLMVGIASCQLIKDFYLK